MCTFSTSDVTLWVEGKPYVHPQNTSCRTNYLHELFQESEFEATSIWTQQQHGHPWLGDMRNYYLFLNRVPIILLFLMFPIPYSLPLYFLLLLWLLLLLSEVSHGWCWVSDGWWMVSVSVSVGVGVSVSWFEMDLNFWRIWTQIFDDDHCRYCGCIEWGWRGEVRAWGRMGMWRAWAWRVRREGEGSESKVKGGFMLCGFWWSFVW